MDDEPAIVESLAAALSPPYQVEAARSGQAALSFLKVEATDLVILDLHLGAENGLELLPRLRELTPAPILILTGYGSRETLLQSIRAKPDDFLDKPVDVSVLRGRIAGLLDGASPEADPLERVRARIARELDRPFRNQDLARFTGISSSHLRRSFTARFGTSPRAYLEKCRMDRATALLRETPLPIKEIAARVGFSEANTFSTAFRRVYGISPKAFRDQPPPEPSLSHLSGEQNSKAE